MTYLIVGETEESQLDILDLLFQQFYKESFRELQQKGEHPDIHILDGKDQTSIGIDEIKDLQSELFFHPFEKDFQIGIVFEAKKLTPESQNAFLKTLEESSDETVFILCTTNEKNLLPTIVSRSRKIFAPKNGSTVEEKIERFNINRPLVEVFGKIEDISKDRNRTLSFLKSLEYIHKEKLEKVISQKDKISSVVEKENIGNIQTAKTRVLANGNRRLVLENLILKIKK